MNCPHCFHALPPGIAACPQCGSGVVRNVTAVMHTTAVWISTGETAKFYVSLRDVPEALRRRMADCANSANSGTILIADRNGRDRLVADAQTDELPRRSARTRRYARFPNFGQVPASRRPLTEVQRELPAAPPAVQAIPEPPGNSFSWLAWAGVAVVLGTAAAIAAAFTLHW